MAVADFIRVVHGEPHAGRGREVLAAHPDLRALAGHEPISAIWLVALVVAQMALALALKDSRWFVWLPAAYIVGATIDHALWVLIHECSHNLVLRSRNGNRWLAMLANVPIIVPSAMSFIKYHLLHHRHLGEEDMDAGVPGPLESKLLGRFTVTKMIWIAGYIVVQAVRPHRLKIRLFDAWTTLNMVLQFAAMIGLALWMGPGPFKYLAASTIFAIGLHPLGGRWIQEHFALAPNQETYSYYGVLNKVCFNAGYHVEHHDLVTIPWTRLPEVRRRAPEFYDNLQSYQSWTGLLTSFVFKRSYTLYRYIVRPSRRAKDAKPSAVA